jgi:hypothetical protein
LLSPRVARKVFDALPVCLRCERAPPTVLAFCRRFIDEMCFLADGCYFS